MGSPPCQALVAKPSRLGEDTEARQLLGAAGVPGGRRGSKLGTTLFAQVRFQGCS